MTQNKLNPTNTHKTVTHNDWPYTNRKLTPPVFENATQPMPAFGMLGKILSKLSKEK